MSDLVDAIRGHVSEEEVVSFCRDLVRAASENPPGDEAEVAKTSQTLLRSLGLSAEFVEPLPNRTSTISSWGTDGGKTLLFNGHYDVVPVPDPADWPHDPFGGDVVDGKLYGRGSTDMKAGIAACLAAVATLQRAGIEPNGRLLMHFVADEEALGTHGTRYLVENGHCDGIDEALVGEPTAMHIVPAERGAVWLRILTEGVSAHGSTPRLGVNAIEHMAAVIRAVTGMRFKKLHEILGGPTVNVGTIRGGSKVNMVPAWCEIEIDRRTIPGETNDEIVAEFEQALAAARAEVPELVARVEIDDFAEPSETPEGSSIVGLIEDAREAFGVDGSYVGYAGATDGRFLINQGKIPTVVYGPGDPVLAHTTGEYVDVSQLVQATCTYAHIFARFLDADQ
jgi:acetylornithine deacetylase/succinyl-diaminopimelate desuccinylase family protein